MWTKVLRDEEEASQKKEAAAAAAAAEKDKEKAESPEKMSMPLIREDSEERNSDDRAAIEEAQLKVIEEKNSAFKVPSSVSSSTALHRPQAVMPVISTGLKTQEENLEDAPHEPSQSSAPSQSTGATSTKELASDHQHGGDDAHGAEKDT